VENFEQLGASNTTIHLQMKPRFQVDRCLEMRTASKMSAVQGDIRLLDQKITFRTSSHIFKRVQRKNNKRLPLTGRATSVSQYSKNLGRRDLYENIGRTHATKNTAPAPLSQHIAHDSLCNAPLAYPHTMQRTSRQVGALTIAPSPYTTEPSTCFTFHEGSL